MSARVVVVGDALLDVDVEGEVERFCPEAPVPVLDESARHSRPGGAGLAAALAAADGHAVALVTALAGDEEGGELRALLEAAGVEVFDLGLDGRTPTKVRLRADGRLLLRVDRGSGSASQTGRLPAACAGLLLDADAVLVSDYGRRVASHPALRDRLAETGRRRPLVWDPHLRGPSPVAGATIVTPNRGEAAQLVPTAGEDGLAPEAARARALVRRWECAAVVITLGGEGALLVAGGEPPIAVPAEGIAASDPCGAGDRFASALTGALGAGALLPDAVARGVRVASAFVRDGGAGSVRVAARGRSEPRREGAEDVVARVRGAGGIVVMTGGCFDLLHTGHIRTLQAARGLGDCLVVCLNSDASVRRLKGSDRPLVPEDDRAAVLSALACVDAVVVFDEETPARVLERFQPDLFAKGGDYALERLPEADVLARWGGEVVILPYFEGRSTTRLIEELARAG